MLGILARIRRFMDRAEGLVLIGLLAALLSLSFLQVAMRQFQAGLVWADVIVRHLVLWIGMVGAALAASRSRHIRIDALGRLLSERLGRYVGMGLDALSAWICLRLALAAFDFMQQTREFGDTAEPLHWPAWPLQAIIPAAFALMALHFLINLPLRLVDPPSTDLPLPIAAPLLPPGGEQAS